jgi:glutaredoxin 3
MAAGQYAGGEITMPLVSMYCTAVCPYCVAAERLLKSKGVENIDKIRIDLQPGRRMEMMERTGRRTVPQIYIDGRHVGGFDDLAALDAAGGLDPLLRDDSRQSAA